MKLGFQRHGDGAETAVVLHEWLGDHKNWDPVVPYLDGKLASYLFVDLRGYGLSRNLKGAYDLDETVQDILELMDGLGHHRFHVVCHSMSGLVGQYLLQKARPRIKSLFAVSPVPPSGFKMDKAAFDRLVSVTDSDASALEAISARTGSRYAEGWLSRKLAIARSSATRDAMVGYARMFTSSDISEGARGIDTPVRALAGQYDIPIYREESVRNHFANVYPRFDLVTCQEAGHYAMLEAPVFTASQIERFICSHAD